MYEKMEKGKSKSKMTPQGTEGTPNNSIPPKDRDNPPKGGISLADVMTKLDSLSHLSGKFDLMAEDIKQIRDIQDATAEMGRDLSETKAKVDQVQGEVTELSEAKTSADRERAEMKSTISQLQSSIASLREENLEYKQNQQAIAKELLSLRAQIRRQETSNVISHMEFEHLKIEAALRRNNLIIEGIKEGYNGMDTSAGEQVFNFVRNVLGLSGIEIDMAFRLGNPRFGSAAPRPILV